MRDDFILPDIGEGIVECEIVDWLVKEGDYIEEDQPVADVSTDKAVVQIPSMHSGRVLKLYYKEGDIAKVHSPLFAVEADVAPANDAVSEPEKMDKQEPQAAPQQAGTAGVTDFILPDIGEGIVECEIVEWRVKEGDLIEEDQPVADVSTDKAVVEIPSMHSGRVVKLYYEQGDTAKVHSPLFAIALEGEEAAEPQAQSETAPAVNAAVGPSNSEAVSSPKATASVGKVLTTPAVRRVAREHDLDLTLVPATGKNGRVLKEDVLRYLSEGGAEPSAQTAAATPGPTLAVETAQSEDRVEPIKGIRAVMAKAMMASVSTIPHFTYVDEVDITELMALRLQLKEKYAQHGIKLTMMPLFMKALSLAINEFPIMNSRPNEAFTELSYIASHNIGMAVDSKAGLLVPNAKNVQNLSILELAQELTRLIDAARSGRVNPADLKGGTITISNVGAIGGTAATPIINKPEVAIVALGKVQELPRFDSEGKVVARKLMTISWSGDHRVIDGGTIARFSNRWKEYLEDPASMLMAMR